MKRRLKMVFILLLLNSVLAGQISDYRKGFYGSLNLGAGSIRENLSSETETKSLRFAMHFNVGFFICKSVQTGITLNGWLFEPYGEIPFGYRGESISDAMIHIQLYPVKDQRLFFKAAYGLSDYTNLRPGKDNGNGHAFLVAAGFEKEARWKSFIYGIQVSYNKGGLEYTYLTSASAAKKLTFQAIDITLFLGLD